MDCGVVVAKQQIKLNWVCCVFLNLIEQCLSFILKNNIFIHQIQVYLMIDLKRQSQYRNVSQQDPSIQHPIAIHNVCGKFTLSITQLNLPQLSQKMMNASFNRKKLPALVIRKRNPKSTIVLFKTGRGLVIGADQCKDIQIVVKKLAKQLARILNQRKILVEQFQITNIMAVCQLGFQIDIGKLAEDRLSIKNDNIAGVIFRFGPQLKKSIIHRSGKVIICGLKSLAELVEGFVGISSHMQKYKLIEQQKGFQIDYLMV